MNPEKYNPNDILNLYAKNSVNGEHNLKEGKVVNVPSKENWGRVIRDEEHIALYLDENSKKEIYDRIISPVSEIANKYNIELWLAGNTYPIHVTLVSGYLKGLKKKKEKNCIKK